MENMGAAPAGAQQVKERFPLYDTVRISEDLPEGKTIDGYDTFTTMAAQEEVPFLNVRNSSQVAKSYCNLTSTDKLAWPFELHTIGIEFIYPDPSLKFPPNSLTGDIYASYLFKRILPEHCHVEFWIREDKRLSAKVAHLCPGVGITGYNANLAQPLATQTTMTNGVPTAPNRWTFVGKPIMIPADTPIKGILKFSPFGKNLLNWLQNPGVLGFDEEYADAINNEAQIRYHLGGYRFVQRRGEYYNS